MYEIPGPGQHSFIVGRNGSGKTQLGAFELSESDLERRPHIIIDFKRDELLNAIPYLKHIGLDNPKIPKEPGVYMAQAEFEDDRIENFLREIWQRENAHIHIDETYMIDKRSKAFNAILAQGRSKRISMTCLSQRPTNCSRWIVSEATRYCVFDLNDDRDKDTLRAFMPDVDLDRPLPEFHSHFYNVKRKFYTLLSPVPDRDSILETFDDRLRPKHKYI